MNFFGEEDEIIPQWKERKTTLSQLDRSFDIEFWQEQEASVRFAAA